jgi:hypothetical protein
MVGGGAKLYDVKKSLSSTNYLVLSGYIPGGGGVILLVRGNYYLPLLRLERRREEIAPCALNLHLLQNIMIT